MTKSFTLLVIFISIFAGGCSKSPSKKVIRSREVPLADVPLFEVRLSRMVAEGEYRLMLAKLDHDIKRFAFAEKAKRVIPGLNMTQLSSRMNVYIMRSNRNRRMSIPKTSSSRSKFSIQNKKGDRSRGKGFSSKVSSKGTSSKKHRLDETEGRKYFLALANLKLRALWMIDDLYTPIRQMKIEKEIARARFVYQAEGMIFPLNLMKEHRHEVKRRLILWTMIETAPYFLDVASSSIMDTGYDRINRDQYKRPHARSKRMR